MRSPRRLFALTFALMVGFLLLQPATTAVAGGPTCFGRAPTKLGTQSNDILRGTSGVDVLIGLGGKDIFVGRGSRDFICGGKGADLARGGRGADKINGGPGNDLLAGEGGGDHMVGAGGRDALLGGTGNDTIQGGPGTDVCSQQAGSGAVNGCEDNAPPVPTEPPPTSTPPCPPTGCPAAELAAEGAPAFPGVFAWGSITCGATTVSISAPVLVESYSTGWSAWWAEAYRWDGDEWVEAGESTEYSWAYHFTQPFTGKFQRFSNGQTFDTWIFTVPSGWWYQGINWLWDSEDGQWRYSYPQSFRDDFPYFCPVG